MKQKKYICVYCGNEYDTGQKLGGHITRCVLNPKFLQYSTKKIQTRQSKLQKKQFIMQCLKCNTQFILNLTKTQFESGKYRKYCSRSCANSRIHSKETKEKIKASFQLKPKFIPEYLSLTCLNCLKQFMWCKKRKNSYKLFCSHSCGSKYGLKYINHSEKLKNAYKNGKKVGGGYTKWIQYNNLKVQGTFEYRVCKVLDQWIKSGKIEKWQYSPDRIKYIWQDGTEHFYIPDFKIYNNDKTQYYIQVKGYKKKIDEVKWKQTIQKGYHLIIWFKNDIIQNELLINKE